ncbi:protein HOTHEAD isoform X2 [Cryptomeria japonica]|nr:protein HOTHEAD isoform X2 [Cryptomeria japonica]XP_059070217.1 protein HOTHEAD isoform X2 [Cryptomeria japonica]
MEIKKNILVLFGVLWCFCICGSAKRGTPPYHSRFIKEATQSPTVASYDYIIVGGGTAGCPLAATLSQNFTVLLLERGGSPYGNNNITRLENFSENLGDNSPTAPSQQFVSEDGVYNHRARVLGGGSCLNAGFYTRAAPVYVEDAGWDGQLVNESYPWVEKIVAHRPIVRQWQTAVYNALIDVGITPSNGFTYDHKYGTKVGGSIFDTQGNRHTAADLLGYADPKKLTVLLRANVHKVYFTTQGVSRPAASGVMYTDANGQTHTAYLTRRTGSEVIISAGSLGSPQLLMLSGVGPADHLTSFGIPVVVNLPAVGEGMSDNPMNSIYVPSPNLVEASLIEVVGITNVGSYIEAASIDYTSSSRRNYGMMSPEIGQLATVPPKQRTKKAIAHAVQMQKLLPDIAFRGGFILEKIMGPLSSGQLRLRTTKVEDNPSVTFNYFQNPLDLQRCVAGMQIIENLVKSPKFINFTYSSNTMEQLLNFTTTWPINVLPKHKNDNSSLQQFCKDTVMTIWHYHGGCQVGRVVDQNYRVFGVDALRVIDGSTFNASPGTNPQATVMMLGRYMGVKILEERGQYRRQ